MKKYKKLYEFYLDWDEESQTGSILPEYYVDNTSNIPVGYALRFLQNELNAVLNSFLNGGFSHKGFIFYPFINDISSENINKIKRLKKIAVLLNSHGYGFNDSIGKYRSSISGKNFAEIVSCLYQDFSSIKTRSPRLINKSKCEEFDIDSYGKSDLGYLSPLNELKDYANRYLREYLAGFYLHGSFATKDYVKGWSDVDTLAIISRETIENPKKLLELRDKMYLMRYFFYKVDPLQHHGSMIISEHDAGNYCNAYFPVEVFRHSKSFFNDDKAIKFKARNFSNEALSKLFWFVSYFRKLNKNKVTGSYGTKSLLHAVTLFPTLYLQAKGISLYKRYSFDIAKKDFKKNEWQVIDEVSALRLKWEGFPIMPPIRTISKINPLLFYQLNSRLVDFLNMNKNKIDAESIIKGMHTFSESAWSKIKNAIQL